MQKSLSLLSPHMGVGITEDETDGREEVTFSRAVTADDDIMLVREWLDHCLIFVTKSQCR